MNKISKLIFIIMTLLVPFGVLYAQDEPEEQEVAYGTFIISASSGSLTEASGETLTLTLEGVPDMIQWFINTDGISAGLYFSTDFNGDWGFASEDGPLVAEAILVTANETITLLISEPSFFEGVFTYAATVVSIIPADEAIDPDKAELPESFDSITLFIPLYPDLSASLIEGLDARLSSTRGGFSQQSCSRFPCG